MGALRRSAAAPLDIGLKEAIQREVAANKTCRHLAIAKDNSVQTECEAGRCDLADRVFC